jgi:hypothetical protein
LFLLPVKIAVCGDVRFSRDLLDRILVNDPPPLVFDL